MAMGKKFIFFIFPRQRLIFVVSEVARSLLDAGIDVNSQNDHGVTPLIFAAQGGHKDLVCVLSLLSLSLAFAYSLC